MTENDMTGRGVTVTDTTGTGVTGTDTAGADVTGTDMTRREGSRDPLATHPNTVLALAYHEAVSRGAVGDELAGFFHEDVVHQELPNALFPAGAVRDLGALREAAARGQERLSRQSFDVLNVVASDGQVALEVLWTGTLAVPLGNLPAGHVMRAHIATFLEFRDGRIVAQRNYDCYEPLDPARTP
ncbi:nuclear transport factor 2 family protein [Streptomyces sp. NPDC001185]|uniref:nuclear transport factor 2 family protein n=1 Tax=Streptomyces sp. NPDC001185 TaxID=3154380 RepID=UPI00332295C4